MIDGIRRTIGAIVERLAAADARTEALAEFVARRRVLALFPKAAHFVPLGRVWRLGVFLLGTDGTVYAVGSTTRAVPPGHPGFQSISAEERRGYRAAAFAGDFERGETINFGAQPIELTVDALRESSGPLFIENGQPLVRWNATAPTASAFGPYLDERVGLLSRSSGW